MRAIDCKGPAAAPGQGEVELSTDELGPRIFECPECHLRLSAAEELGTHLERHREVLPAEISPRGKPLTYPCPKGCGRNFPVKGGRQEGLSPAEVSAHIKNCAGQPPLLVAAPAIERKEAMVAKGLLDCPKCGKKYVRAGVRRDKHIKNCDGSEISSSSRSPRRSAPEEVEGAHEPLVVVDKGLSLKERIIGLLEVEEDRLGRELGACKAMISAVRETGGGEA